MLRALRDGTPDAKWHAAMSLGHLAIYPRSGSLAHLVAAVPLMVQLLSGKAPEEKDARDEAELMLATMVEDHFSACEWPPAALEAHRNCVEKGLLWSQY